MEKISDQRYLKGQQYHDPRNLNARIKIHTLFSTAKQPWNDFVFSNIMLEDGISVLELGCGNAMLWQEKASEVIPGCNVCLSDLSFGMITTAASRLRIHPNYSFIVSDSQQVPCQSRLFDRVIANHMLYHVPDIDCCISEVKRVLKPGGVFMAATNGEQHMSDLYDLVSEFEPAYQPSEVKHKRFSIENGVSFIQPHFRYVSFIPYISDLVVTDATLLADYVFSMWDTTAVINNERYLQLINFFQARIDRLGSIFIRKFTGIFIAADDPAAFSSISVLQAE